MFNLAQVNKAAAAALLLTATAISYEIMGNTTQSQNAQIINFASPGEHQRWRIINDTVMGGRSSAKAYIENHALHFGGQLSLKNNGEFASVRRIGEHRLFKTNSPIEIRVVGDGRRYQFRVRTNRTYDGIAYVTEFQTLKDVEQTFLFSLSAFEPRWRGRIVTNAPALSLSDVTQIGFMLADKQPGTFELAIHAVKQLSRPQE